VNHPSMEISDEQIEHAAQTLAKVAAEWGGEYDGWDRPN
jgi:hypothetical protein